MRIFGLACAKIGNRHAIVRAIMDLMRGLFVRWQGASSVLTLYA